MTAPVQPRLAFRPLVAEDLPLVARWLAEPYVREWWGEPAHQLDLIRETLSGKHANRPFIILCDDRPAGYIQAWRPADYAHGEWLDDEPWLALLPAECIGIDMFIGEPDALGQGLGTAAIRQLAGMLMEEGHATIIIDPDPANLRAVRTYEKAGFRPMPALLGRTEDALLMQFHPEKALPGP